MVMATRCPSCETVFRVTPQQMQARQGQVRCGRCMTVFDGFRSLTTLPDGATVESAAATDTAGAAPEPAVNPGSAARAGAADETAASASSEFGLEPAEEAPAPAGTTLYPATAVHAPVGPGIATDLDEEGAFSGPAHGTWPWAVGIAILLVALAGQAAYLYRSELAAQYPVLKPTLFELCRLAGCSVPLPQRPRLINIEASDLQIVDPARPEVIQLTATLRNHAGHEVGFPALDLVLTNQRDHTLARRIFLPAEYLDPARDPNAGIPAKGEVTVHVDLDTGTLGAAGFRLELLPAPSR
jgi:predicted Zn finger-like uncharacterized protein